MSELVKKEAIDEAMNDRECHTVAPAHGAMIDAVSSGVAGQSRVFLIANNQRISDLLLHNLAIQENDTVVHFNLAAHFPKLLDTVCNHMFVFHHAAGGTVHGFTADGACAVPGVEEFVASSGRCVRFVFSHDLPEPVRVNSAKLLDHVSWFELGDFLPSVPYPKGLRPSIGYGFAAFLKAAQERTAARGEPFYVYLVGFDGTIRPVFSQALHHDFFFERERLKSFGFIPVAAEDAESMERASHPWRAAMRHSLMNSRLGPVTRWIIEHRPRRKW